MMDSCVFFKDQIDTAEQEMSFFEILQHPDFRCHLSMSTNDIFQAIIWGLLTAVRKCKT